MKSWLNQGNDYTYAEQFKLDPTYFDGIQLDMEKHGFSIRTFRRLSQAGIMTAGDLLSVKESDLRKIRGFGQQCANEVNSFLQTLAANKKKLDLPSLESSGLIGKLEYYRNDIYGGDFSFARDLELTYAEKVFLERIQEGYELLDHDLILQAKKNSESLLLIQRMLLDLVNTQEERRQLVKSVEQIPVDRQCTTAIGYINTFSEKDLTRNILKKIYGRDDALLKDILKKLSLTKGEMSLAVEFAQWCAFDITEEVQHLFDVVHKKENMRIVLKERSNHSTLEFTGQVLGLTRERVRQIEKKIRQIFSGWYKRTKILSQIAAIRNGDHILTAVELQEYFGQYTAELLYLLRTTNDLSYLYDSQLDAFIVEEIDQSERVQNFMEELPDTFNISKMESIQKDAEEKGLSVELLMLSINDTYKLTGNIYHRSRLSIQEICKLVLKQHYKNGMNVYDEQQLSEFRSYVETDFGDVGLPKQNRALTSDITRVSILCGRGKYKVFENDAISKGLLDAICRYIDESEKNIFLTNTLFSVFEEELLAEGIDNKYYLQGLMHRQLGDRYVFRRDYVSKDDSSTSIYMEIVNYIKRFDHPVSKIQILEEYPGITEIVFQLSISDPKIISFHKEYIHADRLDFRKEDIQYFRSVLDLMLLKNGYCNVRDVYVYIDKENPICMRRLYIMYQSGLFSVLEYLFGEEYQFSRPYIAYQGIEISHASERMDEMVKNTDEITLAEIYEYAREIHLGIYSILDFADEHNDSHLLKNDKELISIESSGVDEACASQIEKLILDEIKGTMLISQLKSIYKFPKVSVPWTEWLIYSVIKKWSGKLDVSTESSVSSRQFRYMHPIVAVKGNLSVKEIDLEDANNLIETVDDLDEIDDLVADIIVEELGDLESDEF